MLGAVPLGRIFGIKVNIDWSWFFIFLLVTWHLTLVFGQFHPDWGLGQSLVIAVLAALLFFTSVLIHEFAHSLVAKAQGLPVRSITLFLFGGVSNIEREPPSPRAEFLITIVGPISSFILGVIFLVLGNMSAELPGRVDDPQVVFAQLGPLATVLLWLGSINIILAIFNLIPGFPLDGGRILRSILWAVSGSLYRATRWAAWVGQAVAWIFIVAGIAMVFGIPVPPFGAGLQGLWLAFIGWFLNTAASQSYQQMVVQNMLEGVPVRRLTRSNVPTVQPDMRVGTLVHEWIIGTDDRAFPVMEGDYLVGLVTITDVRKTPGDTWDTTSVWEIMTPAKRLDVVSPQEDVTDALNKLTRRDVSQMPVMENGRLVGLLRRRDISRWLELQSERAG